MRRIATGIFFVGIFTVHLFFISSTLKSSRLSHVIFDDMPTPPHQKKESAAVSEAQAQLAGKVCCGSKLTKFVIFVI